MNIIEFQKMKALGKKISMITCYDYSFAKVIAESQIDSILVGDSASMVMHGHPTTLQATVDMMEAHTAAVVRGAPNKLIIGDLPFMSYRKSLSENVIACERLMRAGAHALKLEGADGNIDLVHHLVQSGIPIMGHLGLTPQSIHQLGGFKVQGKTEVASQKIFDQALCLQQAGAFGIVLECVPSTLARRITESLEIPTIGIGAGPDTDGQVLVLQDMLGINQGFRPKFLRKYLDGADLFKNAFNEFHQDIQEHDFPNESETYL